MSKLGRNDPCPCGSGKKYKKCCLTGQATPSAFTKEERAEALAAVHAYRQSPEIEALDEEAWEEFWGDLRDLDLGDHEEYVDAMSDDAYDSWFAWDLEVAPGRCIVDGLLQSAEAESLSDGARAYLRSARGTCLRVFEVTAVVPDTSITLRDLATNQETTIRERKGSRTMTRWDVLAARVFPVGASGLPEIDGGCFLFSRVRAGAIRERVQAWLDDFRRTHGAEAARDPGRAFWVPRTAALHQAWVACWLPAPLPELQNTDGEDLVLTRTRFTTIDRERVVAALDGARELERDESNGTTWVWSAPAKATGQRMLLGRVALSDDGLLVLETNSAERAARGREFLEHCVSGLARYVATTHADPWQEVAHLPEATDADDPEVPPEVAEKLVLAFYDEHYHRWLDEPIPRLGGATPRKAAASSALLDELLEMLKDLEHQYSRALADGKPAYDPAWMWDELGLGGHADAPTSKRAPSRPRGPGTAEGTP